MKSRVVPLVFAVAGVTGPLDALDAQEQERRDSAITLPTIIVTATRAPAAALTTPQAVARIGEPTLRGLRGYGLDEALRFVPGVLAQSRAGGSDVRLVIRGFGARGAGDRSNAGTSRGVRILVDGIPETEPDGRTAFDGIDLASAEAVEVVRSNGSALWGNAAGGVVNVLTVPTAEKAVLEMQPIVGSYGLERYAARASTPLSGGSLYANATQTSFDGWREHSATRRTLVNLGSQALVGDQTRLGVYAVASRSQFDIPGPLTRAQVDSNPRQANATYLARSERRDNRIARLGMTVDRDLSDAVTVSGMLFVNPKYLQRSERGTYRDFTRYHVGGNVVARARARLTSSARNTFTVGADEAYQSGAILFYSLTPEGDRGTTLRDNKGEGANNFGVFAQDELLLGQRLTVSVGARYDHVGYYYRSFITPALNADKLFRRVTPKVGVSYLFDGSRAVYASLGGGIEVPAGNETDPAGTFGQDTVTAINPLLEPIRSTTYEVGFKDLSGTAGERTVRWSYDLALYTTTVVNEIVPYRGGRFYFTAGRARRSGAELGLDVGTRAGVFGRSALTWQRHRYSSYLVDSVHYGVPGAFADYSGNRVVGVPDVIAQAELGLEVPGWRAAQVRLGLEHTGAYWADDANTVRVPDFTIFDLTAELRQPLLVTQGWGIRGFVTIQNLANRHYIGSAFLNPDVVNGVPVAFEPGLPRTLVVSLSVGRLR